ncbi:MAG: tetratricopeptide repeat protein, partial [Paraprevotella sp.]|nr:tetratricopeptide repeat protein [Paraprevotella sp.]
MRSGNRLYRDSMYTKAEVDYRKAIEANGRFSQAYFNLGNSLLRQQKPKDSMQAYEQAVKLETNNGRLASMYHNMGVILQ